MRESTESRVECSLSRAISWVIRHQYRGYEPADGNLSPLFVLTGAQIWPMRILQQVVLRAPFNIRPLLGIASHESAIGRGYMAWGYLLVYRVNGNEDLRRGAIDSLEWLMANHAAHFTEFCWGDPYEYATRSGRRPYGEPLLIWSSLIGLAFLDAYETLHEERFLNIAGSIGRWILRLPREQTATGSCLSYVADRQSYIHNSNVMGGAFLARLASFSLNKEFLRVARAAMTYTCERQRADGSWYYAEESKYHWIDNFHTGYNLSALQVYRTAAKDESFDDCIEKGLRFYKDHFFEADGRPKYLHDKTYPVDIQCAAQAIETLASFGEYDSDCMTLAMKVATWTIDNMQDEDGHFYYRDIGWKKVKTPMLHWGQGTMIKALAILLQKLVPTSA